jgi:hypothetical protein
MIGGRSNRLLRVVAQKADLWNILGRGFDDAVDRSALLDRCCAEIDRDPASVTRWMFLPVSYDRPAVTRVATGQAIDAGFSHLVLGLSSPYPVVVVRWVVDELITPTAP